MLKTTKYTTFLKCYKATALSDASSCTSGPDHLCSDGKCYSQKGCPTNLFFLSNNTCRCGIQCSGISTSSLQVSYFLSKH